MQSLANALMWKISGAFATLCGAGIPLWILGIPGVENDFARGWRYSFMIIVGYPIVWWVVVGLGYSIDLMSKNKHSQRIESTMCVVLFALMSLAIWQLVVTFEKM